MISDPSKGHDLIVRTKYSGVSKRSLHKCNQDSQLSRVVVTCRRQVGYVSYGTVNGLADYSLAESNQMRMSLAVTIESKKLCRGSEVSVSRAVFPVRPSGRLV